MNISDLGDDYEIEELPQPETSTEIKEDPSEIESFLRGASQGASFGFSDEITGAGEAALKTVVGKDKIEDILDNYRKYRDESREAYKAAEEANPASYITGDIGAGIGTGLATGGAGLVANLGKTGVKTGLKELAKLGAKEGAAFGLGQSEADLTQGDLGQAAQDTAVSAGAGATLASLIPSAAKATGKIAEGAVDLVKGSKIGQNFSDAYDLAKRGIKFLGKEEKDNLTKEANQTSDKLIDSFEKQYKSGSKKIGEALTSDSSPKDVITDLNNIENMIKQNPMPSDDLARFEDLLNQFKETRQNPSTVIKTGSIDEKNIKGVDTAISSLENTIAKAKVEAQELGQDIKFTDPKVVPEANVVQSLQTTRNELGEVTPRVRQVDIPADEFEAAQTLIDYVPGEIVSNYKNMSLQELQIFKKQMQDLANSNKMDNYAKSQASKASKEIDQLIKNKMSPESKKLYESGNESMSKVYKASDFLKEIGSETYDRPKARIDLADKMTKPNTKRDQYLKEVFGLLDQQNPELFQQIKDIGTKSRLQKTAEGNPIFGILPSPNSFATYTGNAVGAASTKDIVKIPAEVTKRIMNAPENSLRSFSDRLINSGNQVQADIGNKLLEALNGADKKDRLLWSLSRQPAFRQLLEEQGLDVLGLNDENPIEESDQSDTMENTTTESPVDKNVLRQQILERYRNR